MTDTPPHTLERQVFHIYVDESSKSASYFGVGAVFCRRDAAEEIADFMSLTAASHNMRDGKEFRWNDLTKRLLPAYREVGTGLVRFTKRPKKKFRYKVLIMESRKVNKKLDPNDNFEVILAKFIFTLLRQFANEMGQNVDYHVFIDSPTGEERQADRLFYSLNNECTNDLGFTRRPFKTVKFVLSERSRGVQAADLITGAIAYETNRRHLESDASEHRRSLWTDMLAASGLKTFAEPTSYWPPYFQIWHFDFDKSKRTRFG
jgi:Protein of unknown function (DUF3800)